LCSVQDQLADTRLSLALLLARQAGQEALARRASAAVDWKTLGERVTDADVALQSWILQEVATLFPEDGVIAEEAGRACGTDREFVWIVDPLDGTNNYALGIPCFAVSVGIFRRGLPYAGAIHDPNTGLTCQALHGHGAFAHDRRLWLKAEPLRSSSNVSIGVPVDPDLEPVVARWLRRYKIRGFGSVALHLAYAALGAIDLVLDHRARLWDIAAGAVVLLEAGGVISDPRGQPLFPFDLGAYRGEPICFLAGNPLGHQAAVVECRDALAVSGAARH
jgi:myo-inositol-1(or 4)-monophosphatase